MRGKEWSARPDSRRRRITPAHAGKSMAGRKNKRAAKDHPRPCGEKDNTRKYERNVQGSPPPMRGKERHLIRTGCMARITPAHAGKSSPYRPKRRRCGDHPRPCGEKLRRPTHTRAKRGSPPPMRGKVMAAEKELWRRRITPAHAGKSYPDWTSPDCDRDHPRPCGEKMFWSLMTFSPVGSPPPMRGKACGTNSSSTTPGITPAHAGKSHRESFSATPTGDHPRPCGEKLDMYRAVCGIAGSPPPMRGKGSGNAQTGAGLGITPAHAGKSAKISACAKINRDHPRPCGEKAGAKKRRAWRAGSPPPMRGKGGTVGCARRPRGITPAHAGKSDADLRATARCQDHPRPCGEKKVEIEGAWNCQGSPPPMRGKDIIAAQCAEKPRITPAHAGKRLRKRRNTGIFVFQISRFHSVSHTPDTSYGNRPALYVRRLHRTPAALQASKAYDRARWAAYAWLFAVCPHTGS